MHQIIFQNHTFLVFKNKFNIFLIVNTKLIKIKIKLKLN